VAPLMGPRPTFHAEVGAFLMHLRHMKGWSQRKTVQMARQRGLSLSLGSLRFLEEGKTKHPERALLKAVATLYDVPFELLVQRFVEANYGVSVKVATGDGGRPPTDPTLARVRDLESRVAQYQSTIAELRDIVDRAAASRSNTGRDDSS
jgi:hypothetical protein